MLFPCLNIDCVDDTNYINKTACLHDISLIIIETAL